MRILLDIMLDIIIEILAKKRKKIQRSATVRTKCVPIATFITTLIFFGHFRMTPGQGIIVGTKTMTQTRVILTWIATIPTVAVNLVVAMLPTKK